VSTTYEKQDPGQPHQTSSLLKSYQRAVFWRKLMLVAFGVIFVAILFWAIPWLPYGLSVEDYNDRLTLFIALILMASVTAFGTVYQRDLSHRVEQTLFTWSTVHDGLTDLRQREYFYDRIVIECERSKASGNDFSVIALRVGETAGAGGSEGLSSEDALRALQPIIKDSDCLAALGPHEIGVLVPRLSRDQVPSFAERLRSLLEMASSDPALRIRVGWAVYPRDAEEAGSLVGLAREMLLGKSRSQPNAEPEDSAAA
jgi:GGDEF domain-containing protein